MTVAHFWYSYFFAPLLLLNGSPQTPVTWAINEGGATQAGVEAACAQGNNSLK